jgi:hypothetical protein
MKQFVMIFCSLLPIGAAAQAQSADEKPAGHTTFWEGLAAMPAWGRPFWADMHSTLTRGEVAYATNSPEYDWAHEGGDFRPYVFANLGADLPVWSGSFANKKYGLSVTLPFMVDVWLDMFERTTAPIINTGYRFGAFDVGFMHRLEAPWHGIKNYAIRLSPLKHECTHIGDELTIHRAGDSMSITRVNVSYNYAELMLTVNDPDGSLKRNHALRLGVLLLHNFERGWYDILPEEGDVSLVEPSHRPFELYVQYQFQTNTSRRGFQGITSVELRQRERYNYPFSYSGKLEDFIENRQDIDSWLKNIGSKSCVNIFAGVRYNNPQRSGYFSKMGVGFRYYRGINPYGQFRSQPIYNQLGVALLFE